MGAARPIEHGTARGHDRGCRCEGAFAAKLQEAKDERLREMQPSLGGACMPDCFGRGIGVRPVKVPPCGRLER